MSSSDSTQKINLNKKSLSATEDESGIQFSVVKQLNDEGPITTTEHESGSSTNASSSGGDFGAAVSHLHLVKLQSNVDKLESQIKLISTFASETKVLEAEMNKIIKKLYQAQPKLKPYLMRMKKLLKDHTDIEKILEVAKDKVETSSSHSTAASPASSAPSSEQSSKKPEIVKNEEAKADLPLRKKDNKNDEPEDPNFTKEMSLADLMAMQEDDAA